MMFVEWSQKRLCYFCQRIMKKMLFPSKKNFFIKWLQREHDSCWMVLKRMQFPSKDWEKKNKKNTIFTKNCGKVLFLSKDRKKVSIFAKRLQKNAILCQRIVGKSWFLLKDAKKMLFPLSDCPDGMVFIKESPNRCDFH